MGIVHFGIPEEEARWLCDALGLETAVETGTYKGETARLLGSFIRNVYTIEKSEAMAIIAKQTLSAFDHVKLLQGDTRDHLPNLVATNDGILFWLDAHWCGDQTYGVEDECPLLEELDIIFSSPVTNYAVLIDDARLFTAPPPLPHNRHKWPTIKEICAAVPSGNDVTIHHDVIYIMPQNPAFQAYIQDRTTEDWANYQKRKSYTFRARSVFFLKRVKKMFKSIFAISL